jgi:hypothetical protein
MHFKKLEILNTVIYRQQYNEFRTTKTKYPSRRLMKKFANTADFLDYLSPISGPTKRIFLYEIAFTNGWKIKEHCYTHFTIYTNSLEERNTLINYLINSVGYDPITIDLMEPNITYYFKASGSLEDYKFDVTPDEFWSEERLQQWKEAYIKKNYKEEELEKGEPFIDTNNIFTDFPSIKLKGWTEGDPF